MKMICVGQERQQEERDGNSMEEGSEERGR